MAQGQLACSDEFPLIRFNLMDQLGFAFQDFCCSRSGLDEKRSFRHGWPEAYTAQGLCAQAGSNQQWRSPCSAHGQVLYCCFKRNLRSDVKVAQLVGYVGLQLRAHVSAEAAIFHWDMVQVSTVRTTMEKHPSPGQ